MGGRTTTYGWALEAFWGKPPEERRPEDGKEPAAESAAKNAAASAPPAVFVVFDLETTGLDPRRERIVEIGALKFDRRGPIGRFSVLIDPQKPMPAEASRVNGITDRMLAGKPTLDAALPDFLRFIDGAILMAHNAPFDCSFVNAALAERWEKARETTEEDAAQGSLLGGEEGTAEPERPIWSPPYASLPNRIVDTIVLAKETFPGRWKYSLQEMAKYLGIDATEAHRAEDDARVCMEVFIKCAEKADGREVSVFSNRQPA